MTRYTPEVVDETLYLVGDDDRVAVGDVDEVVAAVGGDSHAIEYDEKQRAQPWLDTDEGVLEIDVRETVTTLPHTEEFVADLREKGMGTDRYGIPTRTVAFATGLVDILERQGKSEE